MTVEDRLRSLRLGADAAPLRASVLRSAERARREQRLWRWTWVAAAAVLVVAIPVNLAADRVGTAIAARAVRAKEDSWPADLRDALRARQAMASSRPVLPRTLEEIR